MMTTANNVNEMAFAKIEFIYHIWESVFFFHTDSIFREPKPL